MLSPQPNSMHRTTRIFEVLIITVAGPVLGWLWSAHDPFLLKTAFPWLLLAPLFAAAQHGLVFGLCSFAALGGAASGWAGLAAGAWLPGVSWLVGGATWVVVVGLSRDSAQKLLLSLAARADYLREQLERSERHSQLVSQSHAQLEQRLAGGFTSLASAIDEAERRMARLGTMQELSQVLLDVLAGYGMARSASLYISDSGDEALAPQPIATFGSTPAGAASDALVLQALRTRKISTAGDRPGLASEREADVLLAVPLVSSKHRVLGVVAIHRMPAQVLQSEHLTHLHVLAGHLSDMVIDRWHDVNRPSSGIRVFEALVERDATPRKAVARQHTTPRPRRALAPEIALPPPASVTSAPQPKTNPRGPLGSSPRATRRRSVERV